MLQKYERYDGSEILVTIFFDLFSYSYVKIPEKKRILNEPDIITIYNCGVS